VSGAIENMATASALFPGEDDLRIKVAPAQKEYAPGATARLEFSASTQVALGIAIVDQSVMERAATDQAFGKRAWFNGGSPAESISGVTLSDLLDMDPSKIDADVEVLAEVLAPKPFVSDSLAGLNEVTTGAYQHMVDTSMAELSKRLDGVYLQSLQYPKDAASYQQMGVYNLQDPWLQPYDIRFCVENTQDVMELWSSGPDKKFGTPDDFMAGEVRRPWFVRLNLC